MRHQLSEKGTLYSSVSGAWTEYGTCRCVVGAANFQDRMMGVYEAPVIGQALSDTEAHTGNKLTVGSKSYLVLDVQYAILSRLWNYVLGAASNV